MSDGIEAEGAWAGEPWSFKGKKREKVGKDG
jgi:hypothetical protein